MTAPLVSRVGLVVANAAAGEVELFLPSIPPTIVIPERLIVMCDANLAAALSAGVALSHQTDHPALTNIQDPYEDPTVWSYTTFGTGGPLKYETDLKGSGWELGGPQSVLVLNNNSGTLRFGVWLWYRTKEVTQEVWAAVKTVTSFEEI